MNYSIITECNVDTNLVETIVPPAKEVNSSGYNHQMGCGTVSLVMQRNFANDFAVGIIDKDKHAVDYLTEFNIAITTDSLILHKHKTRNHFIIQICPAMERFILKNAETVGVILEDFGLYSDFNKLKKITKTANSKADPRFKNLFKTLKKKEAPDVIKLAAWINYLKENPYTVNVEAMKNL